MGAQFKRFNALFIQFLSMELSVFMVIFGVLRFVEFAELVQFDAVRFAVDLYILLMGGFTFIADVRILDGFGNFKLLFAPGTGRACIFYVVAAMMSGPDIFSLASTIVVLVGGILYHIAVALRMAVPRPLLQRDLKRDLPRGSGLSDPAAHRDGSKAQQNRDMTASGETPKDK